jgi:uncharacterized membrane protein
MTPLGFLGGDDVSQALDITGSGDIVVGFSQLESIQRTRATIWNEASQPLSIASILTREGIDLTGWTLTSATAVAADGRTVAGFGFNPDGQVQGWVAELPLVLIPEPSTALLLGLGLAVLGVARRH